MKLVATISTIIVIAVGVGLVSQIFFINADGPKQAVMISVSINGGANLPQWCDELSSALDAAAIKATVFVAGRVAENYPECIEQLAANRMLDIGSQTYNYISLLSIPDYTVRLEEIQNGKHAVNNAGKIDSRVFKAPLGETDADIYSLLNRSNIIADFSYDDHYNKYHQGNYIWFNVTSFDVTEHEPSFYQTLPINDTPFIINFDTSDRIDRLEKLISQLKDSHFKFVNASDLTKLELTVRGEGSS